MENFMPRGSSEVKLGPDWSVIGITAIDGNEKVPFAFMGGGFKKLSTRYIIPADRFKQIYRQVRAIAADYEKRAKLARQLKKPNWTFELQKYGVIIETDGCLSISRRQTKKYGRYERIWQTVGDINSAIRQQDHILEKYLEKKNVMENGDEIPSEYSSLLKRLSVIMPYIEMRRELLIFAQTQMDQSIKRTIKGLEILLKTPGTGWEKCHGLPEKLERLAFFLNNNWPNPYRQKINQVMPMIKEAKKSAANLQWVKAKSLLFKSAAILENYSRQNQLISISEIDPIWIMAKVDEQGLADDILHLAKKYLSEPYYYKSRGLFRLNALLAVAKLVLAGKIVNQETIIESCR